MALTVRLGLANYLFGVVEDVVGFEPFKVETFLSGRGCWVVAWFDRGMGTVVNMVRGRRKYMCKKISVICFYD